MRTDNIFTQEYLKSIFTYANGNLYWKETKGRKIKGGIAGTKSNYYWQVCINYKIYRVHRIIWIYHNATNPDYIDHINGNTFDNRIENLRDCNINQNRFNSKKYITNTSGVKGVNWCKQKNKWRARVFFNNKEYQIGFFNDIKKAEQEIIKERKKIHGEFSNNG
jgi:hypothetical protein